MLEPGLDVINLRYPRHEETDLSPKRGVMLSSVLLDNDNLISFWHAPVVRARVSRSSIHDVGTPV